MLLVQCVGPKSPVRVQDNRHELETLPGRRYAAHDIRSHPPFRLTLRYALPGPPLSKLFPLCLVHLVEKEFPQKLFRAVDRGHLLRESERHDKIDKGASKRAREPLGSGAEQ